ncbi:MAG: 50S ribosomal protein L35 [Verrucomicrobiae bacterium]|nr:50S ribosomal protein L35 [Verrucomicrobiae bacterium]
MPRFRPPKTKKSVAKRFKITANGKVLRCRAGKRHLAASKNAKKMRFLSQKINVDETDKHRITQALPYSHRG